MILKSLFSGVYLRMKTLFMNIVFDFSHIEPLTLFQLNAGVCVCLHRGKRKKKNTDRLIYVKGGINIA